MVQGSYTEDALATMVQNPQDRMAGVAKLMEALGGRLISGYFSLGDHDVVIIAELPDEQAGLAAILAAHVPGHLKGTTTTTLYTAEEAMAAMNKAKSLTYSGPTSS
jgi:uncharacterized protein with GYD domain